MVTDQLITRFSKRRISLENFKDSGGGLALPHLYSHNTITEYLSERDLDDIKDIQRLLRLVTDITPYSRNLFRALRDGNSASSLAQWAESRNNVQYANKHYVTRFLTESNRLSTLSDREKTDSVMSWLQNAEIYQGFIRDVLGRDIYKKAPVSNWIEFFENGDLG